MASTLECSWNGWLRCSCEQSGQRFEGRFHIRMDDNGAVQYVSCVSCGAVYHADGQVRAAVEHRTEQDE